MTGNPEAEATLQRQRGLVPNAAVFTNTTERRYYYVCGRLADDQIEEIVADSRRANKLKTEFRRIRTSP